MKVSSDQSELLKPAALFELLGARHRYGLPADNKKPRHPRLSSDGHTSGSQVSRHTPLTGPAAMETAAAEEMAHHEDADIVVAMDMSQVLLRFCCVLPNGFVLLAGRTIPHSSRSTNAR